MKSRLIVLATSLVSTNLMAAAAFQDPSTASWGGWNRGDSGTVFAHWDVFDNLNFDATPDIGSFGTEVNTFGTFDTALVTTGTTQFFVGGNIYSFSEALRFDALVDADSAHEALGLAPITVALQLQTRGEEIDPASVLLNSLAPTSTTELMRTSIASGNPAGGATFEVETLYTWELANANVVYAFDFDAAAASLSLGEVSIDIGPSPVAPAAPPTPVPVPAGFLLLGLAGLPFASRLNA